MCSNCGTKTESNGSTQPTEEERRWEVGRVEACKCPNCGKDERFPRYNHPGKLLGKLQDILLCAVLHVPTDQIQHTLYCTCRCHLRLCSIIFRHSIANLRMSI